MGVLALDGGEFGLQVKVLSPQGVSFEGGADAGADEVFLVVLWLGGRLVILGHLHASLPKRVIGLGDGDEVDVRMDFALIRD